MAFYVFYLRKVNFIMNNINHIKLHNEDGYTSILLHPTKNIAYFGTNKGTVEIWNLSKSKKVAELHYMIVDDYGEQQLVDDPVVSLAAPSDFSLVYAFMGNAAYCIDTDIQVIIQQIPISETVISGNVSPKSGYINVITKVGYLSQWSPKFYERVFSHEFPYNFDEAYILSGNTDKTIIIILPNDEILEFAMDEQPYIIKKTYAGISSIIYSNKYDCNHKYFGSIHNEEVEIVSNIPKDQFKSKHKLQRDQDLRSTISKLPVENKEYITDFRVQRKSVDRYRAELSGISSTEISITDDSRTINYAIDEYYSPDYTKKSRAKKIIEKIADRHHIPSEFILFSWKLHHKIPETILEYARFYSFEQNIRRNKIKRVLIFSFFITLSLILSTQIKFSPLIYALSSGTLLFIQYILSIYWRKINKYPRIPKIQQYSGIRGLFLLFSVFSFLWGLYVKFNIKIPFL